MKEFKFRISADVADLEAQFKSGTNQLAKFVQGIDKAENKLEKLQETGTYLSQMDAALSSLASKYPNIFKQIFGNVDADIKNAIKPILEIQKLMSTVVNQTGSKLQNILGGTGGTAEEFKEIANTMSVLSKALGKNAPDFSFLEGAGDATEKANKLLDVLQDIIQETYNFKNIGSDSVGAVLDEIAESSTNAASKIDELKTKIKELISIANKKKEELYTKEDILGELESPKNVSKSTQYLKNRWSDLIKLMQESQEARAKFNKGEMLSDADYESLLKYIDAVSKLRATVDTINSGKMSVNPNIFDQIRMQLSKLPQTLPYLENLQQRIQPKTPKKKGKTSQVESSKAPVQTSKAYAELNQQIEKYIQLKKESAKLDEESPEWENKAEEMDQILSDIAGQYKLSEDALETLGDKLMQRGIGVQKAMKILKDTLGDQFPSATVDQNDSVGIKETKAEAIQTASEIESLGDKSQESFSEVAHASQQATDALKDQILQAQTLKELYSLLMQEEYNFRNGQANGKEYLAMFNKNGLSNIGTSDGADITRDTIKKILSRASSNGEFMSLHNHPNGMDMPSVSDLLTWAQDFVDAGVKINGIITSSGITAIDFSDMDIDGIQKVIEKYKNIIQQDKLLNKFLDTSDPGALKWNETLENKIKADSKFKAQFTEMEPQIRAGISGALRNALNQALEEVGGKPLLSFEGKDMIPDFEKYLGEMSQNIGVDPAKIKESTTAIKAETNAIAQKITAYEELCQVVERYNALILKSHAEGQKLTQNEEAELSAINDRFAATKGVNENPDKFVDYAMNMSRISGILGEFDTNKLAQYLGVEIPQSAQQAQQAMEQAVQAFTSFQTLTSDIQSSWMTGTMNSEAIGKYTTQIDMAKTQLQEFANQGLITAEQMEQVNSMYEESLKQINLSREANDAEMTALKARPEKEGEPSGSYDSGFDDGYSQGQARAAEEIDELQKTVTSLQKELSNAQQTSVSGIDSSTENTMYETLKGKITEVITEINAKTEAFKTEGTTVDSVVAQEISALDKLLAKVNEIKAAVDAKTGAFKEEGNAVSDSAKQAAKQKEKETSQKKEKDIFGSDKEKAAKSISSYFNSLNLDFVSDSAIDKLSEMETRLKNITNSNDLDKWKQDWKEVTKSISQAVKEEENIALSTQKQKLNGIKNSLSKSFKATGIDSSSATGEQKDLADSVIDLTARLETYAKQRKQLSSEEIASLQKEANAIKEKADAYIKAAEAAEKSSKVYGDKEVNKATDKKIQISGVAKSDKFVGSVEVSNALVKLNAAYDALIAKQKEFKGINPTEEQKEEFANLTNQYNQAYEALNKLIIASRNLEKQKIWGKSVSELSVKPTEDLKASLTEAINASVKGKVKIGEFDAVLKQLNYSVRDGNGSWINFKAQLDSTGTQIVGLNSKLKRTDGLFKTLFSGSLDKFKQALTRFTGFDLFYKGVNEIRKGVQSVTEIDSALTELKKVTDETDETYAQFLKTMSKTGAEVGATVSNLTNMAANWARLGYSIEEAGELAKSTAVLLNVSEFTSADDASEALISIMQAYGYAAEDSMHVVDVLNEVGNNFAVSSDGLATALQTSASALMSAGNDLNQSVALVAAANKVLQDPSQVGAALRTIALRIRGTSLKVLEEMGEETDGVIESVSKLQEKVKAISGVNILDDHGAYRDTYDILRDIAEVWDEIGQKDPKGQAALLEMLAGKNRSNALAAILTNLNDLEGAYESAMNAQGSAEAENEKYMNSIQGKVDQFKNALQTMWQNQLGSDIIKTFVGIGTSIVQVIDKIGLLKAVLISLLAISVGKTLFKRWVFTKIIKDIASLTLGFQNFNRVTVALQIAVIRAAIANGTLGVSFTALLAPIWAATQAILAFLLTNPVGQAMLISGAIIWVAAAISKANREAAEAKSFETLSQNLGKIRDKCQELNSELSTVEDRIDELEGKDTLSFTDVQELKNLQAQRIELERLISLEKEREKRQAKKAGEAFVEEAKSNPLLNGQKVATYRDSNNKIVEESQAVVTDAYNAIINVKEGYTQDYNFTVVQQQIERYNQAKADVDKATQELTEAMFDDDTTDKEIEQLEKKLNSAESKLQGLETTLSGYQDEAADMLNQAGGEWQFADESGKLDDWQIALNKQIQAIYDLQDTTNIAMGTSGTAKVSALDRIFKLTGADDEGIKKLQKVAAETQNLGMIVGTLRGNPQLVAYFDKLGIGVKDVANYLLSVDSAVTSEGASVESAGKAYSSYASTLEKFTNAGSIANEIIYDNIELTEDQGKALQELIGSEAEYADAVNTSNGYVVKNAKLVKDLIKKQRLEAAYNAKTEKSQARLKYYELYKQIKKLSGANGEFAQQNKEQINALYAEMDAVAKAVQQYSMLEQQLLGVTNAYTKFADAKEIDDANNYDSQFGEMVQALANAFNTGYLGTEQAQAAIAGLIPDEVIEKAETLDEKMQAVYDYFTGGPLSKYLTVEFDDEGSMTNAKISIDNLKQFVEDGVNGVGEDSVKVFTGSWESFDLAPGIKSISDIADAWNITEEAVFTFLQELEKTDISWIGGDFTTLLDKLMGDNLERQAYKNTQALTELEVKLANGAITVEEYTKELYGLKGQLNSGAITQEEYNTVVADLDQQVADGTITLQEYQRALSGLDGAQKENVQNIRNNAVAWDNATTAVTNAKEQLSQATEELNVLREKGASEEEIQIKTNQVAAASKALEDALVAKYQLQEPTEMTLQLASDNIDEQIKAWKRENSALAVQANIENIDDSKLVKLGENGKYEVDIEAVADPETQAALQTYLDLINDQKVINILLGGDEDAKAQINEITTAAEAASQAIENLPNPAIDSSAAVSAINNLIDAIGRVPTSLTVTTTYQEVSEGQATTKSSGANRVNGTAHSSGDWGLAHNEHNTLVGELGQETVVDPHTGRYYTVGDNGAELVDLPKNAIIFNHKQTEELFKNGHINSRGKAYVEGNAHVDLVKKSIDGVNTWTKGRVPSDWGPSSKAAARAAKAAEDAAKDAAEIFDWFEVLLEEINEQLDLMSAKLENAVGIEAKGSILGELLGENHYKLTELNEGLKLYTDYAAKMLSKVPDEYKEMAKNGAVAITDFLGEADQQTVDAINNYREWAQKVADLNQQLEETRTTISDLRVQTLEMIRTEYDNEIGLITTVNDHIQSTIDLLEEQGQRSSSNFFTEMIANSEKQLDKLKEQREAMQKELDDAVASGDVKKYSENWYEMLNAIYDVDSAIVDCKTDIEKFNNAILELHWENFEKIIDALDAVSDEAEQIRSIIDDSEITDDVGNWTNNGLTALGMAAQEMEKARYRADLYGKEIEQLNQDFAAGKYSQDEYNEKLKELKDAQWDSIEAYESAKDTLVDLNKTRVEAVKDGIQKEIDAYEKLIDKRKEDLNAQKDAHDWANTLKDRTDEIDKIQRQIDAMTGDTSAAANAQRKKLQEELAKAQKELDETYYDRDIEMQQKALDDSLESYRQSKEDRIQELEDYLKNEDQVISDSYALILANTDAIASNLQEIAQRYGISISESVTAPWESGTTALGTYGEELDYATSTYVDMLEKVRQKLIDLQVEADKTAAKLVKDINTSANQSQNANQTSGGRKDIAGFAKGTTGVKKDQFAVIDENGLEELVMHADGGKLSYLTKGTAVIPNDLTNNIMKWGEIDPVAMLDRNKPSIGAPYIIENQMQINMDIAEVVHIEHADRDSIPEIQDAVKKQLDSYMKNLNSGIKKYTR